MFYFFLKQTHKEERRQLPSPARIPRRCFPPAGAAPPRLLPQHGSHRLLLGQRVRGLFGAGAFSGCSCITAPPAPSPSRGAPARPGPSAPGSSGTGQAAASRPALPCPAQPGPAQPGGHLPSADGAISMRVSLAFLPRRFMAPRLPRAPPGPCSPAPGRLAASRSAAVRWGTG